MIYVENPIPKELQIESLFDSFIEEMKRPLKPISTSIPAIDRVMGGYAGLVVIGGGPGTGKTALAIQGAIDYAKEGGPVIYLAYEQGPEGFFHRVLQRISSKSTFEHRGLIQDRSEGPGIEEKMRALVLSMPYLHIEGLPEAKDEKAGAIDSKDIKNKIESLQEISGKRALVVVDSLHYTPLPDADNLDGKRYIDKSLRVFTALQQSTKAAIVCICHQTKAEVNEGKNDAMSFSGSATIGYAADVAMQLVREEDSLSCHIPKNRFGMVTGDRKITMSYNLKRQTIY